MEATQQSFNNSGSMSRPRRGGSPHRGLKTILRVSIVLIPYLFVGCLTIILMSCGFDFNNMSLPEGRAGSLTLDVDQGMQTMTLLPDVDMTPAAYSFHGMGPNGATFAVNDGSPPVWVYGLASGHWSVSVNALNAEGLIIGQGQAETTVEPGNSASVTVPVRPVDGHGTLDITLLWNDADTYSPSVEARLTSASGSPMDLTFTITAPGVAECVAASVPTGYHTLTVKLLDNGMLTMGAVEVVRIVSDQTTSGTFEFFDINQPGGDIVVNITPEMYDPIPVTLSGQETTLAEGGAMTVSASVPADVGNVTCVWYLNGDSQATGESYTFGSDLPLGGVYRLDVTVFSADGTRAGSAGFDFNVVESTQVTLAWDPNTETDLAGYKLYYGGTSGDYSEVMDVGSTETCTVPGLLPGETYYFAATAYNTSGLESGYSNEVMYTVPL